MTHFEYNAPQFRDFTEEFDDSDGADTFFDVESDEPTEMAVLDENKENSQPLKGVANVSNIIEDTSSKQYGTRDSLGVKKSENQEKPTSNSKKRDMLKAVRRLSAVGVSGVDQEKLSNDLNKLSVKNKRRTCFDGIALFIKEEKHHTMTTRSDQASKTPTIELRTRVINKEPAEVNNRKRKSEFGDKRHSTKYMAMAEKILHFQKDTPPRFHSNRRLSAGIHKNMLKARKSYNPRRTIALTPKLMTAMRSRPLDVMTKEQKEEMELEEMKKHQVKPIPLNEKIFQPPKPPRRSIRPPLVAEPFQLTEVFKKPVVPKEEPYRFTAKPVPKAILQKPIGVGKKQELPVTVPQSPAITKPTRQVKPVRLQAISNDNKASTEALHSYGVPFSCKFDRKTEVKPFSFESRDKEMIEKREKKIQEILQAEKKAREFKANPVPSFAAPKEVNRSSKQSHLDCSKSSMISLTDEGHQQFRARSPRVLRKAPFEPKLEHCHSQPMDVHLWTQRRAHDRQDYEIKQLEKQERLACLKEQIEMEKRRKEEEEIIRLRKETVHKAQPVPKFAKEKALPKLAESNLPLTSPMSPRFSKRTRINAPCSKSNLK